MQEVRISSFSEFHEVLDSLKTMQNTIFRGQSNDKWPILTSVGRLEPRSADATPEYMEARLLKLFKESALPFISYDPRNNWEWLALGLPTRFLDWSYNPMVAAFFAVEKETQSDSAVFMFWGGRTMNFEKDSDPLQVKSVVRYRPSHVTSRITAQAGLFTVHQDPSMPFEHKSLLKIIISNSSRQEIKKTLYKYGISRKTLFPGLDGLAADLHWLEAKKH
jgi:FRG domain